MPNTVHNLPTTSAQTIVKLGIRTVYKLAVNVAVFTNRRLYTTYALFSPRIVHILFRFPVSVKSVVIRTIHSAYKRSQRLKTLNYLLITSGELS